MRTPCDVASIPCVNSVNGNGSCESTAYGRFVRICSWEFSQELDRPHYPVPSCALSRGA